MNGEDNRTWRTDKDLSTSFDNWNSHPWRERRCNELITFWAVDASRPKRNSRSSSRFDRTHRWSVRRERESTAREPIPFRCTRDVSLPRRSLEWNVFQRENQHNVPNSGQTEFDWLDLFVERHSSTRPDERSPKTSDSLSPSTFHWWYLRSARERQKIVKVIIFALPSWTT